MIVKMGHSPYIQIVDFGTSPSGKTKIWLVRNTRTDEDIGHIRWHGPWRGYVFEAAEAGFYDEKCLKQISDFIITANQDHKSI